MSLELNLRFPEPGSLVIKFDESESDRLSFEMPLTVRDQEDIRWYLEVYSAQYTADVDDGRARRIEAKLPQWGEALFEAAFRSRAAQRYFNDFQDCDERGKLITISARHPDILSLPWELLRDPEGTYLVHDNPRISVRRRFAGAGGGRRPFKFSPKETVRVLFVISRPSDAGFIDPRGEAQAVMAAIEREAAGRVVVEFLRPATLTKLVERLEDERLPAVDILHFDGHGVYDADGRHWEDAKLTGEKVTKEKRADSATKSADAADTGYLLFEEDDGTKALVSAETLGDMLNRQKVGLIVLSACQSAMVGATAGSDENSKASEMGDEAGGEAERKADADAMGSVAARLTHGGIPAVLAMTHSVLVTTTQQLFGQFYQNLARGRGWARRWIMRGDICI
ncbi:MAG: CHAT domain-containing protein [Cyanobacteria bacterium J06560_6]